MTIYLGQQRSMKTVFERIINLDKRNYDLKALKDNTNQAELSKIKGFIESYYGSEHYIRKQQNWGFCLIHLIFKMELSLLLNMH